MNTSKSYAYHWLRTDVPGGMWCRSETPSPLGGEPCLGPLPWTMTDDELWELLREQQPEVYASLRGMTI